MFDELIRFVGSDFGKNILSSVAAIMTIAGVLYGWHSRRRRAVRPQTYTRSPNSRPQVQAAVPPLRPVPPNTVAGEARIPPIDKKRHEDILEKMLPKSREGLVLKAPPIDRKRHEEILQKIRSMSQSFADQIKAIAMSSNLAESLERALKFAHEQPHREVTLEHFLLALTEDPDAAAVLEAGNVDLPRLGADVSDYLCRLPSGMRGENRTEPGADPELLRVLRAAEQAAKQSSRRQIDGAIVLAAIIGDGKSRAAALLKARGLAFEEVIRALQKSNAPLRAKKAGN